MNVGNWKIAPIKQTTLVIDFLLPKTNLPKHSLDLPEYKFLKQFSDQSGVDRKAKDRARASLGSWFNHGVNLVLKKSTSPFLSVG